MGIGRPSSYRRAAMLLGVLGVMLMAAGGAAAQEPREEELPPGAFGIPPEDSRATEDAGKPKEATPERNIFGAKPERERRMQPRILTGMYSGSVSLTEALDSEYTDLGLGLGGEGALAIGRIPGVFAFAGLSLGLVSDDSSRTVDGQLRDVETYWGTVGAFTGVGWGFTIGGKPILLMTATGRQRYAYRAATDLGYEGQTSLHRSGYLTYQRFAILGGPARGPGSDERSGSAVGGHLDLYRGNDIGLGWAIGLTFYGFQGL